MMRLLKSILPRLISISFCLQYLGWLGIKLQQAQKIVHYKPDLSSTTAHYHA